MGSTPTGSTKLMHDRTAINIRGLPGDASRCIRRQKYGHVGNLFRFEKPLLWADSGLLG